MQVQNFECQIAQSQMSRYLAGESFSPEAVKQLNEHISRCVSCKSVLAQRRASLQDQLSRPIKSAAIAKAVVEQASRDARMEGRKGGSPEAGRQPSEEAVVPVDAEIPQKVNFVKPLVLSSALAVILIGMTVISRDPTTLFGERAAKAVPAITPPVQEPISSKKTWSGSALAASLRRALIAAASTKAGGAANTVAPAQVPLNQIKPLTTAANDPRIGGQIGDVGDNGLPKVTVYAPKETNSARKAQTKPAVAPRKSKSNSNPAPRQPRGIVIYDPNGTEISRQGAPK